MCATKGNQGQVLESMIHRCCYGMLKRPKKHRTQPDLPCLDTSFHRTNVQRSEHWFHRLESRSKHTASSAPGVEKRGARCRRCEMIKSFQTPEPGIPSSQASRPALSTYSRRSGISQPDSRIAAKWSLHGVCVIWLRNVYPSSHQAHKVTVMLAWRTLQPELT
jgi:hypothetical protein